MIHVVDQLMYKSIIITVSDLFLKQETNTEVRRCEKRSVS